jgi:hypothetical protein
MNGAPECQAEVDRTVRVEDLIEADHPLRAIKRMAGRVPAEVSRAFDAAVVPEKNNPPRGRGVVVRTCVVSRSRGAAA